MTYKDLEDKGVTLERTLRGEAGKIRSSFFYTYLKNLGCIVLYLWTFAMEKKLILEV